MRLAEFFDRRGRKLAELVAGVGMAATFGLFVFAIGMRHVFGLPQSWVDEVVTIIATWLVFWTSAFVLRWSEFISFDVLYMSVAPRTRRWLVMAGSAGFVVITAAALWGVIDFILFMRISTTDMLQLRLDKVYSIFAVFLVAMSLRLAWLCLRLAGPNWEAELAGLDGAKKETAE